LNALGEAIGWALAVQNGSPSAVLVWCIECAAHEANGSSSNLNLSSQDYGGLPPNSGSPMLFPFPALSNEPGARFETFATWLDAAGRCWSNHQGKVIEVALVRDVLPSPPAEFGRIGNVFVAPRGGRKKE
jgi:hypothetical protein